MRNNSEKNYSWSKLIPPHKYREFKSLTCNSWWTTILHQQIHLVSFLLSYTFPTRFMLPSRSCSPKATFDDDASFFFFSSPNLVVLSRVTTKNANFIKSNKQHNQSKSDPMFLIEGR